VLSIQGIYTGREIKPLEEIHIRPNVRVIITFLDDAAFPMGSDVPEPVAQHSALEILNTLPGHRLFQTAAEVDAYLTEERDVWDS
jgi:hypothetical protein